MRAIVWQGPERMTIEERPDPRDPGAGEVIVRDQVANFGGKGGLGRYGFIVTADNLGGHPSVAGTWAYTAGP